MPALAAERPVHRAIPVHPRLAQPRAGGNDAGIAAGAGRAGVQGQQIPGCERGDAPGIRFQIVEEIDAGETQLRRHRRRIDDPGQIRRLHAAVADGAGNAETGMADLDRVRGDELGDDFAQSAMRAAGVGLLDDHPQAIVLEQECGEPRGRAARVSGQNHRAIFAETRTRCKRRVRAGGAGHGASTRLTRGQASRAARALSAP